MNTQQSLASSIKLDKQIRQVLTDHINKVLEENLDNENEGESDYYCEECSYTECFNYDDDCECCCHEEFNGYIEESRSAIVNYIFNTFIPNYIIPKVAQDDTQP
jgi:DNA replication protein DnaC